MAISKTAAFAIAFGGIALVGSALGNLVANSIYQPKGVPEQHGKDPRNEPPFYYQREFKEEYRTVIYLNLSGADWIIRHAAFNSGANVDAAVDCLANNTVNCNGAPIFGEKIHRNLDNLMFSGMHKIFVYIDGDNVDFQRNTPISFTPFGANEINSGRPTRAKNYTFFRMKFNPVKGRDALEFENHFRDADGWELNRPNNQQQPEARKSLLSINFNLLRCREIQPGHTPGTPACNFNDPAQTIPFVYDPDTGNGYGYSPPKVQQ